MRKMTRKETIGIALFLIICYFPIFLHLDGYPLFNWDESLYGLRMFRLVDSGEFLTNFGAFEGMKSFTNYKPPFITILQALFIRVFGFDQVELAMRLPSALSVLGIILLFLWLFKKTEGQIWPGMLASMVLLTSGGFLTFHVARTGDHDAPLALLTFSSFIFFFSFFQSDSEKDGNRYLWLGAGATLLAFFTKTIAAFFFFPGFLLFIFLRKKGSTVFSRRSTYWALLTIVIAVIGYYIWMDQLIPGFLGKEKGQLARFRQVIDHHQHPFIYYFKRLFTDSFWPWVLFLPFGIWKGLARKRSPDSDLALLAFLCFILHFLVLSIAATKLSWYESQSIPLLSILTAMGMIQLVQWMDPFLKWSNPITRNISWAGIAILLFAFPFWQTVDKFYGFVNWEPTEHFAYMLQKTSENPELQEVELLVSNNKPHAVLYREIHQRKGRKLGISDRVDGLQTGQWVLVAEPHLMDSLHKYFEPDLMDQLHECRLYRLVSKPEVKPTPPNPDQDSLQD